VDTLKSELTKNIDKIITELAKNNDVMLKLNKDTIKILSLQVKKIN
jgi:hypothetical protein